MRILGKLLLSLMLLGECSFVGALVRLGYQCRASIDPMMGSIGLVALVIIAALGAYAIADLWKTEVRKA